MGDAIASTGRRSHFRVPCDVEVEFHIEGTDYHGVARAANMGLGGARLDLPIPVRLPATLRLRIHPAILGGEAEKIPIFTISGRIIWTVEHHGGGPFPCGVHFQDMDDESLSSLHRFIGVLLC